MKTDDPEEEFEDIEYESRKHKSFWGSELEEAIYYFLILIGIGGYCALQNLGEKQCKCKPQHETTAH